jgi:hypothetical protein
MFEVRERHMPGHPIERSALRRGIAAVAFLAALLPTSALAYNFKPTPAEWAMWPDYCKARYVTTSVGKNSPYVSSVPPAMIQNWTKRLGNTTYTHVHHYCASLVYMQRASTARTNQERNHLLRLAEGDCNYTLKRIPPTSPIYRDVAAHHQYVRSVRGTTGVPPK